MLDRFFQAILFNIELKIIRSKPRFRRNDERRGKSSMSKKKKKRIKKKQRRGSKTSDKIIVDRSRAWEWIITWKTILLCARSPHFRDIRDQDSRDRRLSHFWNRAAYIPTIFRSHSYALFLPLAKKNARNEWVTSRITKIDAFWNRYECAVSI